MINNRRRLITGHRGFVGQHALRMWPDSLKLTNNINDAPIDLRDYKSLEKYISILNPNEILHLAGISFIPDSIENPRLTYDINFNGTLNLLEALKNTGFKGKFLFVSSGDVYGVIKNNLPITENNLIRPRNPYAVSKAAAENLCYQWSLNSTFEIVIARPFNHIGTGQSEKFVISDFAKQITHIACKNKEKTIRVGNIDVTRDFSDVHDVLHAYDSLFNNGKNSESYNICSGQSHSIRSLLEKLINFSGHQIDIEIDPKRWRPTDQQIVFASNDKIFNHTGWVPRIPLDKTLLETYQFWEKKIG